MEEKNLPYDSVLIELRNKPHWYKDIVPTELTPAAVINGELVYESLDILKVCTFQRTAVVSVSHMMSSPKLDSQCSRLGLQSSACFQHLHLVFACSAEYCIDDEVSEHHWSSIAASVLCTAIQV